MVLKVEGLNHFLGDVDAFLIHLIYQKSVHLQAGGIDGTTKGMAFSFLDQFAGNSPDLLFNPNRLYRAALPAGPSYVTAFFC